MSTPEFTPEFIPALREQLEQLATEAHRPEHAEIDRLPTLAIAELMNGEDRTVPAAVAEQLPRIAAAVDGIAERMGRGGRLVYAGAGTAGRMGVLDASECPPTFNTGPGQVVGLIAGGPATVVTAVEGAEEATVEAALAATGGEVKPAVLVILGEVDAPTAARLLREHAGRLRDALAPWCDRGTFVDPSG